MQSRLLQRADGVKPCGHPDGLGTPSQLRRDSIISALPLPAAGSRPWTARQGPRLVAQAFTPTRDQPGAAGVSSSFLRHPIAQPASHMSAASPEHLVIMVNGLFGSKENWNTILSHMRQQNLTRCLLHPSEANKRTETYDGIDACGKRLAGEITSLIAANPSLRRLSVIGHSMGGLVARYAVGVLYDPKTGCIAGLQPSHFISIATPHLGCDAEGIAQVPFIGWLSLAQPIHQLFSQLSVPVSSVLFRRTGRQFFLADEEAGRLPGNQGLPLVARMTLDVPERGEYFWSALAAFASRTCYANTSGDHLVGWANSSLRFLHSLPPLPPEHTTAKGVVVEDPLMSAFDTRFKPQQEPQHASSRADVPIDAAAAPAPAASHPPSTFTQGASGSVAHQVLLPPGLSTDGGNNTSGSSAPSAAASLSSAAGSNMSGVQQGMSAASSSPYERVNSAQGPHTPSATTPQDAGLVFVDPSQRSKMVEAMLFRLQQLSWRRIDVSFQGSRLPFPQAHNHIQVTRRWLNSDGESVAQHLAHTLRVTEEAYSQIQASERTLQPPFAHPVSRRQSLEAYIPGVAEEDRERHQQAL